MRHDMRTIYELNDVNYSYHGGAGALSSVTLRVPDCSKFAVIGANGSGKSTLLRIMAGLIHPASGSVMFKGRSLDAAALKDAGFLRSFRSSVGYVFQDADVQLFCPTVIDELMFGPLNLGLSAGESMERSISVMQMLNMDKIRDRPVHMLSGGEKKRVAIGSVLTMNPDVLLFDEPTNGLDPRTQCFLVELMLMLSEAGKTIIVATHDLSLVDELHAEVAVLSESHRVEQTGRAEEILKDEELLLRVNLIHEHLHMHGPSVSHAHRHSHYFFHKH